MNFPEKLHAYLNGELPPEEAQALEEALAKDPALALELQLLQLEERDLPAWANQNPGLDLYSWRPGLEALQQTSAPLWFLSLLAGTIVIAGAGMRDRTRREGQKRAFPAPVSKEKGEHRTDGDQSSFTDGKTNKP